MALVSSTPPRSEDMLFPSAVASKYGTAVVEEYPNVEERLEKGCNYVMDSFAENCMGGGGKVVITLMEAVDVYLLGTVMLVFGTGLYELFISNLDPARTSHDKTLHEEGDSSYRSNLFGMFALLERPAWLKIQTVDELKTKLGHVIVMVLLVGLFERSKKVAICTPMDLFCFSASILVSSCGLYLLSKLH
ncbi:hypothetical protein QJS10_CPB11g00021 [Acorus calamus]|uniref:Uncharacterized protein n=1 Tax=Acorus calamus TaxID=4465 RepID=A0AAV9DVM6_ACOCL|nr:hypothetical protein QJS10_CPB11g00021 [Acorus calamus]